ncbi:hypothetical protein DdX_19268 [Ditylenchus destructor]|uniref:Dolichyl-diphosphooligosaccharide--protein glycosyltransferase subunit 1 n=1 Tax=Ditylenchus destructor TaxID=166010 RepID=A0AAD4MKR0_9BILA|nr:hypothetical protein DdX_19268 [Ditylenchus destructor]
MNCISGITVFWIFPSLLFLLPSSFAGPPVTYISGKLVAIDNKNNEHMVKEENFTLKFSEQIRGNFVEIPSSINISTDLKVEEFSYILEKKQIKLPIYVHLYRGPYKHGETMEKLKEKLIKTVPVKKSTNLKLNIAPDNSLSNFVYIKLVKDSKPVYPHNDYTISVMALDMDKRGQKPPQDETIILPSGPIQEGVSYAYKVPNKELGSPGVEKVIQIDGGSFDPLSVHITNGDLKVYSVIKIQHLVLPRWHGSELETVDYYLTVDVSKSTDPATFASELKIRANLAGLVPQMTMETNLVTPQNDFKDLFTWNHLVSCIEELCTLLLSTSRRVTNICPGTLVIHVVTSQTSKSETTFPL